MTDHSPMTKNSHYFFVHPRKTFLNFRVRNRRWTMTELALDIADDPLVEAALMRGCSLGRRSMKSGVHSQSHRTRIRLAGLNAPFKAPIQVILNGILKSGHQSIDRLRGESQGSACVGNLTMQNSSINID